MLTGDTLPVALEIRPSKNPETWNIGGFIAVSVVLGVAMVAETLALLWIGWAQSVAKWRILDGNRLKSVLSLIV